MKKEKERRHFLGQSLRVADVEEGGRNGSAGQQHNRSFCLVLVPVAT